MNIEKILKTLDFNKGNGLIPAIVQDYNSKEVLMLAYINKESLEKTLETGECHYYSRSRRKLWHKGKTSGNIQKVKDIKIDCDNDTILFLIKQKGVACHTGEVSCFYRNIEEL